jgi:hypothetical protein
LTKIKFIFISSFLISSFSFSQEDKAVPVNIIKFNVIGPILQNLNISYERTKNNKSWEIDLSKYFSSNIDNAFGPYIMGVHYKGYGAALSRKYLTLKHGWYYGFKFTVKYKYFNKENVLVSGKAEESDGQEWTLASNKKYAESLCLTFGNLSHAGHFFINPYIALGVSVISTSTINFYTYYPGSYYTPRIMPIPHSNSTYLFPELQFGFKMGLGFKDKSYSKQ